jgi:hypothetical protein
MPATSAMAALFGYAWLVAIVLDALNVGGEPPWLSYHIVRLIVTMPDTMSMSPSPSTSPTARATGAVLPASTTRVTKEG